MYHLYSWENLLLAYRKASKGKRGHANVAAFEYKLEDNLLQLQRELINRTYQPGKYHSFYIHDPKHRLISAAPFRDRVVHHALCNLIEPAFEKSFIFDSYANRIDKGTHKALDRAQQFARRFRYVLTCDIRQFFPSIDHEILRGIIAMSLRGCSSRSNPRTNGEKHSVRFAHVEGDCFDGNTPSRNDMNRNNMDVVWLIDKILQSGEGVLLEEYEMVYFKGDDLFSVSRPRGLPIGNLTSQFWANCYLNPFDHYVKRNLHCKGYVRYVDDFLLFANEKETLHEWRAKVIEQLAKFRLTLHENTAQVKPLTEGIPFLGFLIFPTHRLLKQRKGIAFQRKFKMARRLFQQGRLPISELNASILGWVNHVRYANTWNLRRAILSHLTPGT